MGTKKKNYHLAHNWPSVEEIDFHTEAMEEAIRKAVEDAINNYLKTDKKVTLYVKTRVSLFPRELQIVVE